MTGGDVIPLWAALVTSESGAARKRLDVLSEVGQIVRSEDADVVDSLGDVATEQGSNDPEVVLRNWFSDGRSRRSRRDPTQEKLSTVVVLLTSPLENIAKSY